MLNNSHTRSRRGFTIVESITVVALAGLLTTLASPALFSAREAARAASCKNNLKQIALAFHNYADAYACFSPGWTDHSGAAGHQVHFGWASGFLPFLDQAPLYQKLDMQNHRISDRSLVNQSFAIFRCPSDTTPNQNALRGGYGTSNYAGNYGDTPPPRWVEHGLTANWPGQAVACTPADRRSSGLFALNSNVRFRDVVDGTSNTVAMGERCVASGAGIWVGVRGNEFEDDVVADGSHQHRINSGRGFSSVHPGGAHFALTDGAVRFISAEIDSNTKAGDRMGTYQKLHNRSDGQVISNY